jgi:phage terminase large subunit GpA-like protein
VKLLILDEIERFPIELEGEGATIEIALKRTLAYQPHRRVLLLSSPKLVGGPIHKWFQRGDQRHYYVPCVHCGAMDRIRWANVRWTDDDPATAHLVCTACGGQWGDADRLASLAKGEWLAEHPERADHRIVSFAMWEGYSPLSTLREIVRTFLAARQAQREGDRSLMHTWQNTTLGEPVEPDDGIGVEPHVLLLRREPYCQDVDAPEGVVAITMGVDLQDDRIEALVVGWGLGEESWLLDRQVLPGDPAQPSVWEMLDQILETEYRHALGVALPIHASAVDSGGHKTDFVYDYCRRQAARRVYAVKGVAGARPVVSSPSPRRGGVGERKVDLFLVGVDSAKALLMSRLALTEKGRGYIHIPVADWADEELAAQLTSERLVTRFTKGIPETFWKQMRARNEMLDAWIYSYWAMRRLRPPLEQWSARIAEAAAARRAFDTAAAGNQPPAPAPVETAGDPADPSPPRPALSPPPGRRTYRSNFMDRPRVPGRNWR